MPSTILQLHKGVMCVLEVEPNGLLEVRSYCEDELAVFGGMTCPPQGVSVETDEDGDRYVKTIHTGPLMTADTCPQCGKDDTLGAPVEVEGAVAFQDCSCPDCGAEFREVFVLAEKRDIAGLIAVR